jgi:hypothetical protein
MPASDKQVANVKSFFHPKYKPERFLFAVIFTLV